ncbi:MAG: DNA polymerase III subunit delta [Phycisphaeraceae bacterium]|nr:DNA polymerase III subunit delta [Phycisphaeraceae bacterium]MCB9847213.1 DNA polymerase III subunit delta [Phycisphaeraceae bacterium]
MAKTKATSSKSADVALDATMRIVVLSGKEEFLRSLETDRLREALTEAFGEVEVVRFEGKETPPAEALDECRSFGLLQQHKLVIVDGADEFVKEGNRAIVERYASAPCESATLALRCDTWRAGKLDKLIVEGGGVIRKCDVVTPAKALKWVVNRASKRYGVTMKPDAAEALVGRAGVGLGRLDAEARKLASAAGDGGTVTAELVRELVGMTREEEAWLLQSALLSGRAEDRFRALREALDVSRHDAVFLSFVVTDLLRKIHSVARLMAGGVNGFQAAKSAKLWGPSTEPIIRAAGSKPARVWGALFVDAVENDAMIKSGRADARRSLERLVARFASGA